MESDSENLTLHDMIRTRMDATGLTVHGMIQEISARTGIPVHHLREMVSGDRPVRGRAATGLSKYFRISPGAWNRTG